MRRRPRFGLRGARGPEVQAHHSRFGSLFVAKRAGGPDVPARGAQLPPDGALEREQRHERRGLA